MQTPFAGSFLHLSQNRNSSFFSCAGFLPAKDDPGNIFFAKENGHVYL